MNDAYDLNIGSNLTIKHQIAARNGISQSLGQIRTGLPKLGIGCNSAEHVLNAVYHSIRRRWVVSSNVSPNVY